MLGDALAREHDREGRHVHEQVDGQVEGGGLQPEGGAHHHAGEQVARLPDARPGEQPLERALGDRADVADHDRHRGERGQRRSPVGLGLAERVAEQAQEDRERGGLGGDRHEGRDRGGGALVDVGRPLVERRHRGLERETGGGEGDAGEQQRIGHGELAGADRSRDGVELHRPRGPVDEREAVQERRRPDRADHEVLEPRLERGGATQLGRAQHVERDREQLDSDEQRDQVGGLGEHDHAGDRPEQQGVVLAVAGLAGGDRADRQRHADQPGHVEEHREAERERVDRERALDDRRLLARLPDPDRESDRREERDRGQRGHERVADEAGAQEADHQDDDGAAHERHQRRERLVVDLGGLDLGLCEEVVT